MRTRRKPTTKRTSRKAATRPTLRDRCGDGDLLAVYDALMGCWCTAGKDWPNRTILAAECAELVVPIPHWLWSCCQAIVSAAIAGHPFGPMEITSGAAGIQMQPKARRGTHARDVDRLLDMRTHHRRWALIAPLVAEGLSPDKACLVIEAALTDTPRKASKKTLRASYTLVEHDPLYRSTWLTLWFESLPQDTKEGVNTGLFSP